MMLHTLKVYGAILPVFLIIDYLWLGVIMSKFYKDELGVLARFCLPPCKKRFWKTTPRHPSYAFSIRIDISFNIN
jgi:hypothetical protein